VWLPDDLPMARAATGLVARVTSVLVARVSCGRPIFLLVWPPCPLICWILTASSAAFALTLSSACKEPVLQVETGMKLSGFGRS